jgi:GT2 family glycosyltransferase
MLAHEPEASTYPEWVRTYDTLTDVDRALIRRHVEALAHKPLVSIVMPTYETPERWLRRAIDSVLAQLYPHWELCIADDGSSAPHVRRVLEEYRERDARIRVVYRPRRGHISAASNSGLDLVRGELTAFLDHDDELAEHALYLMVAEVNAHPSAEIVYSDEDKLDEQGERIEPYFKPDWNPDLFLAQNLVTHLCVCRTARVREVGGFRVGYEGAQDWDLVMRIAERVAPEDIRHVPHVLYHWRAVSGSTALAIGEKRYATAAQQRTLATHFARRGETVDLLPVAGVCWRVRYPLPRVPPLVSVVVSTRDQERLLRRAVRSVRERTVYPRIELVIVDNQSRDPATLAYLAELAREPDVRIVRHEGPFNFAELNNVGAQHARGEVLALLNDDVEAIGPGWLEEMVSQACRPEIGAVGAMLYYHDETIQHAGIILGLGTSGIAAHAYSRRPRGYAGQIGRALLAQDLSAVTGACLVIRRTVFDEVGGFDATHLAIAYNDVDLCLRIRERGYRILWTPYAELYHVESASRGYEDTPEKRTRFEREVEYMRRRWGAVLAHDPAYNPNLSLVGESFTPALPPRTEKPWLEESTPGQWLRAQAGGRGG